MFSPRQFNSKLNRHFTCLASIDFIKSLLLQNFSSRSMKSEQPEKSSNQVEVIVDSEELKQMCPSRWSSRCSFSSDIDRTLLGDSIGKSVNLASVQYVDSMLYLTSNVSRITTGDDETVDLTEPRLESFCMGNQWSSSSRVPSSYPTRFSRPDYDPDSNLSMRITFLASVSYTAFGFSLSRFPYLLCQDNEVNTRYVWFM